MHAEQAGSVVQGLNLSLGMHGLLADLAQPNYELSAQQEPVDLGCCRDTGRTASGRSEYACKPSFHAAKAEGRIFCC